MIKNCLTASVAINIFLLAALYLLVSGKVILKHQMHDLIAAAEMASSKR